MMSDPDPDDDDKKMSASSDPSGGCKTDLPATMTLENIIDLTGEMVHLNELVMIRLDKEGGFTTPEVYFAMVQPILDLLEVEIRVRYQQGMSKNGMKLIIQDWIDEEIRVLR